MRSFLFCIIRISLNVHHVKELLKRRSVYIHERSTLYRLCQGKGFKTKNYNRIMIATLQPIFHIRPYL
jgi:hypothetical protein